jgi:hypothetical protein
MPAADRDVSPISIVISWPRGVPAGPARQLLHGLAEARLASTWAIEEPAQAGSLKPSLHSKNGVETAALITATSKDKLGEALEGCLGKFNSAGPPISTIQLDASLPRGNFERLLRPAGVRAVVTTAAAGGTSSMRPLPFGIWEFVPQLTVPRTGLWSSLFSAKKTLMPLLGAPVVASIDLGRVGSASSRGWHKVERLVQQAAAACREGAARNLTIAELAAKLSGKTQARPQRSILRMAA